MNKLTSLILLTLIISGICTNAQLAITPPNNGFKYQPLEDVTITTENPVIFSATDAVGNTYFTSELVNKATFKIGGALGSHTITMSDKKKKVIGEETIGVDCKTEINDEGDYYNKLLKML